MWLGAAAAAGVLLAAGLTTRGRPGPLEPAGTLEMQVGDVVVKGNRDIPERLTSGTTIETGSRGRTALRLARASVRMDVGSAIRIDSSQGITLQRGAVYVDSGQTLPGNEPLEVSTALGSVRHVGTQFEVRLPTADTLRVRVREGAVLVDRGGEIYETSAGDELIVRSNGEVRQAPAPALGSSWDWILRAAPPLKIEGVTLAVFLEWVARETGRTWVYDDPSLLRTTQEVILHGSIEGLTPEEALSVVLPGCGFGYRRADKAFLLERDDTH